MKIYFWAISFSISLILHSTATLAQKESNIWYFGKNAGLDFNTFPPSVLSDGKINSREGIATISDKNTGRLLFYTEGTTAWDATHNVMPNGSGLLGDYSSTQSSIIVPDPSDLNTYYLFTTALDKGFRYSKIDMALNAGKGDVLPASKNTLLIPTNASTEKLIAVQHCNKKDYWVITHTLFSNTFYVYLVNGSGIQAPSTYSLGSNVGGPVAWTAVGYLKLSPSGSKLAHAIGPAFSGATSVVELLNFNNTTGVISGPVVPIKSAGFPYGVEFSPNEKMFYVSEVEGRRLHQYDLTATNIEASITTLVSSSTLKYGALQLGPDGKIYVSIENGYDVGYGYLSLIANPDVKGPGCNYTPDAVNLNGRQTLIGLPTFLANYLKDTSGFKISGNCAKTNIDFNITYSGNIDSVKWNFGDGTAISNQLSPQHSYTTAGNYSTELIVYRLCGGTNDTSKKTIAISQVNSAFIDVAVCEGTTYRLPNGTFVSQPGDYPITYRSATGCDSIVITRLSVVPLPSMILGNDTTFCSNSNFVITAASGFASYLWQDGSSLASITINRSGVYWVEAQSRSGCKNRDSITIGNIAKLEMNLGNDTSICNTNEITLGTAVAGAISYIWNTGASIPQININNPGLYWLEVQSENGCKSRDSVNVVTKAVSGFTLGPDSAICIGQSLSLGDTIVNSSYEWNTGALSPQINVMDDGEYWVTVNQNGCVKSDTIKISSKPSPNVTVNKSNDIDCNIPYSQLNAAGANQYIWTPSNGLNDSTISNPIAKTNTNTTYIVKGTDSNGCTDVDTVTVVVIISGAQKMYQLPNAFTPNGDGRNDCFGITKWGVLEQLDFNIYNRWGEKIFHSSDGSVCWDGSIGGRKQDSGAFVYVIKAKALCGVISKKGIVMLLR